MESKAKIDAEFANNIKEDKELVDKIEENPNLMEIEDEHITLANFPRITSKAKTAMKT